MDGLAVRGKLIGAGPTGFRVPGSDLLASREVEDKQLASILMRRARRLAGREMPVVRESVIEEIGMEGPLEPDGTIWIECCKGPAQRFDRTQSLRMKTPLSTTRPSLGRGMPPSTTIRLWSTRKQHPLRDWSGPPPDHARVYRPFGDLVDRPKKLRDGMWMISETKPLSAVADVVSGAASIFPKSESKSLMADQAACAEAVSIETKRTARSFSASKNVSSSPGLAAASAWPSGDVTSRYPLIRSSCVWLMV